MPSSIEMTVCLYNKADSRTIMTKNTPEQECGRAWGSSFVEQMRVIGSPIRKER